MGLSYLILQFIEFINMRQCVADGFGSVESYGRGANNTIAKGKGTQKINNDLQNINQKSKD
jgi:hypothetical protein